MKRLFAILVASAAAAAACGAHAHDFGCDGKPVPHWIKAACCGPADAHAFDTLEQDGNGDYHVVIKGERVTLSQKNALPSQDQCFWVFYNENVSSPVIYCFLIPLEL